MLYLALVKNSLCSIKELIRKSLKLPFCLAVSAYYLLACIYSNTFNWQIASLIAVIALIIAFCWLIPHENINHRLDKQVNYLSRKTTYNRPYSICLILIELFAFSFLSYRYFSDLARQREIAKIYIKPYSLEQAKDIGNSNFYYYSKNLENTKAKLKIEKFQKEVDLPVITSNLLQRTKGVEQCFAQTMEGLRVLLVFTNESSAVFPSHVLQAGTALRIKGNLELPKIANITSSFSEQHYLACHGIYLILKVKMWRTCRLHMSLLQRISLSIYKLQNFHYYWHRLLGRHLNNVDVGLVQAVSMANGTYLSNLDKRAFQLAGIIHVLVASGQHLHYLLLLLMLGLEASSLNWYKRQFFALILLIIFACFYFYELAFWRALCQFIVEETAKLFRHNWSKLRALSAGNFLLLAWQPYAIISISFQLSLLACLVLYFWQPYFQTLSTFKINAKGQRERLYLHSMSAYYKTVQSIAKQKPIFWQAKLCHNPLVRGLIIMLSIQLIYGICNLSEAQLSLAQILGNLLLLPQLTIMSITFNIFSFLNAVAISFNLSFSTTIASALSCFVKYLRLNLQFIAKFSSWTVNKRTLLVICLLFYIVFLICKSFNAHKNKASSIVIIYNRSKLCTCPLLIILLLLIPLCRLTQYNLFYFSHGQAEAFILQYQQAGQSRNLLFIQAASKDTPIITQYMRQKNIAYFDIVAIANLKSLNFGACKKLAEQGMIKHIICKCEQNTNRDLQTFNYLEQLCQFRHIKLLALTRQELNKQIPIHLTDQLSLHMYFAESDDSLRVLIKAGKQIIMNWPNYVAKEFRKRQMNLVDKEWIISQNWLTKRVTITTNYGLHSLSGYLGIIKAKGEVKN